jgi:hypothetical protein
MATRAIPRMQCLGFQKLARSERLSTVKLRAHCRFRIGWNAVGKKLTCQTLNNGSTPVADAARIFRLGFDVAATPYLALPI